MKHFLTIIAVLLLGTTAVMANDGEFEDPFREETTHELQEGLRYRELKHIYGTGSSYLREKGDLYHPAIASIGSLFMNGLGQFIVDEPERGLMFMANEFLCAGIMFGGSAFLAAHQDRYDDYDIAGWVCISLGAIGFIANNVMSILDASRIAKVKNLYVRDLRKQGSLSLNVQPSFNYTRTADSFAPTAGLTLALTF